MKALQKPIALILAVLLLISLAACGEKSDSNDQSLVGKWKYELDVKKIVETKMVSVSKSQQELAKIMLDALDGIKLDYIIEFDGEKHYKAYPDEESLAKIVAEMKSRVMDVIEELFEETGISADEMEQYLKDAGISQEDAAELFAGELEADDIGGMVFSGYYKAVDGKLYIGESYVGNDTNYFEYEISGNTLTVTDYYGDFSDFDIIEQFVDAFPAELTKVG